MLSNAVSPRMGQAAPGPPPVGAVVECATTVSARITVIIDHPPASGCRAQNQLLLQLADAVSLTSELDQLRSTCPDAAPSRREPAGIVANRVAQRLDRADAAIEPVSGNAEICVAVRAGLPAEQRVDAPTTGQARAHSRDLEGIEHAQHLDRFHGPCRCRSGMVPEPRLELGRPCGQRILFKSAASAYSATPAGG